MKATVKLFLTAFISAVIFAVAIWIATPAIFASADEDVGGNITCAAASGNYLNDDYINVYRVPTSMLTYEANGGESSNHPLSHAFDGNWNTFWYTGTENSATFLNAITVTFSKAVTIESIVYASSSERLGHGYPGVMNLYTANGGELSLYGTCTSAATNNRVVFTLKEAVTVTKIKFEFNRSLCTTGRRRRKSFALCSPTMQAQTRCWICLTIMRSIPLRTSTGRT
ncbi:MAG: discoidin domain-containing protein [Clostridiales bacterium]|nr:discoidin domain-containing protein [Clostridiales bacterium]